MQLIRRNSITFGKIDAKNAMVSRDALARRLFLDAFVLPPTIDLDAFHNGDRYLIFGTKGSGKTALLRYLMEQEKKRNSATKFVVFSEDISIQEKGKIADGVDIENINTPDIEDNDDLRDMWRIYIVKCICDLFVENRYLCNNLDAVIKLRSLIYELFDKGDKGILDKIARKIKSATLRFKAAASDYAEFEAIVNYDNTGGDLSVSYSRFADIAIETISRVEYPEDVRFCLYIDEINLSMLGQKQHKKDSILIRDLILTIGHLNRIFTDKSIPIYIYAAVRMEVAKAINVSRNELDKYLIDHGQQMLWHRGFEIQRYPLFKIIETRIGAIEKEQTGKSSLPTLIWQNYFSGDIYGVSPKQFLSEVTWCNPRDLVNLFNLASNSQPSRARYDTEVFSSIAHEYSERVWGERAEELNAEHSMTVVNAIRRLLSGSGFNHFKVETLKQRADILGGPDPQIRQAVNTVGIEKICRDLYHVGILGQSLPLHGKHRGSNDEFRKKFNQTWFYRDNREFDPSGWLFVHLALYPALKLPSWNARHFAQDPRVSSSPRQE